MFLALFLIFSLAESDKKGIFVERDGQTLPIVEPVHSNETEAPHIDVYADKTRTIIMWVGIALGVVSAVLLAILIYVLVNRYCHPKNRNKKNHHQSESSTCDIEPASPSSPNYFAATNADIMLYLNKPEVDI